MKNKIILIPGGTGALGRHLIERYHHDNKIIVFSRDEHKHYNLLKDYPMVKSIVGDIRDKDSVMNALLRFNPNVVINAAAQKHVPVCEDNPYESVKTNIIGHQNVIECINLYGKLETLIFVSTDKACKPINIYGMCKAISEQLYISFAKQQNKTKVVTVRYGNVLESTGSVIPYFKGLLEDLNTKTLPITDYDMTRFLLTLEQATDLIHWAYEYPNSHGKIAIPKVKSLKVTDVANAIYEGADAIMLSGETSVGKYPVDCIKMLKKIATKTEDFRTLGYEKFLNDQSDWQNMAISARDLASRIHANGIVVVTRSGQTADVIASTKPFRIPIYAFTNNKETFKHLSLVGGMQPHFLKSISNQSLTISKIKAILASKVRSKKSLKFVLIGGVYSASHTDSIQIIST